MRQTLNREVIDLIIRENGKGFVMIEQHHHASISGNLFNSLRNEFKPISPWKKDIEYAIYNHDYGWIPFDQTPFCDDTKNAPYSFITFPTAPKTVLYENGINVVEEKSSYAALLCSKHYSLFLQNDSTVLAKQFVENEKNRQERIKRNLQPFTETQFNQHYELLQFFDNLSLYICLNEPNVKIENEHPFFKNGIALPSYLGEGALHLKWKSNEEIEISQKIFESNIEVFLQQKSILKEDILKQGLQKAYREGVVEEVKLTIDN